MPPELLARVDELERSNLSLCVAFVGIAVLLLIHAKALDELSEELFELRLCEDHSSDAARTATARCAVVDDRVTALRAEVQALPKPAWWASRKK